MIVCLSFRRPQACSEEKKVSDPNIYRDTKLQDFGMPN